MPKWYLNDPSRYDSKRAEQFVHALSFLLPMPVVVSLLSFYDLYHYILAAGIEHPATLARDFLWSPEDPTPIFSEEQAEKLLKWVRLSQGPQDAWIAELQRSGPAVLPAARPAFRARKNTTVGGGLLSNDTTLVQKAKDYLDSSGWSGLGSQLAFLTDDQSVVMALDVGETLVFWIFEVESIFPEVGLAIDFLNANAPLLNEFLQDTVPVLTAPLLAAAGAGAVIDAVTLAISVMFSLFVASLNFSRKRFAEAAIQFASIVPFIGPLISQFLKNVELFMAKFRAVQGKIFNIKDRIMMVPQRLEENWHRISAVLAQVMALPSKLIALVGEVKDKVGAVTERVSGPLAEITAKATAVSDKLGKTVTDAADGLAKKGESKLDAAVPSAQSGSGRHRRRARTRRGRRA